MEKHSKEKYICDFLSMYIITVLLRNMLKNKEMISNEKYLSFADLCGPRMELNLLIVIEILIICLPQQ